MYTAIYRICAVLYFHPNCLLSVRREGFAWTINLPHLSLFSNCFIQQITSKSSLDHWGSTNHSLIITKHIHFFLKN